MVRDGQQFADRVLGWVVAAVRHTPGCAWLSAPSSVVSLPLPPPLAACLPLRRSPPERPAYCCARGENRNGPPTRPARQLAPVVLTFVEARVARRRWRRCRPGDLKMETARMPFGGRKPRRTACWADGLPGCKREEKMSSTWASCT